METMESSLQNSQKITKIVFKQCSRLENDSFLFETSIDLIINTLRSIIIGSVFSTLCPYNVEKTESNTDYKFFRNF